MAKVTGVIRDFDMLADDDLGMAGNAAKLPPLPDVFNMRLVVEIDAFLGNHLPLQEPGGVASIPKTGGVLDFGERFGRIRPSDVFRDLGQGLKFFPEEGLGGSGRVMAIDAGDVFVFGSRPRIIVRLHDVTGTTKRRSRRVDHQAGKTGHTENQGPDNQVKAKQEFVGAWGLPRAFNSDQPEKLAKNAELGRRSFDGRCCLGGHFTAP